MSRFLAALLVVCAAAVGLVVFAMSACKSAVTVGPQGSVLSLFASPTTVALGGTVTITASLFRANGQPVPEDTQISFTTTLGQLVPESGATRGGFVQVALQAGTLPGKAKIVARSGAAAEVSTEITVGGQAMTVLVEASPAALPKGGGATTISATLRDANGILASGVRVVFSSDHGAMTALGNPVVSGNDGVARDTLTTSVDTKVTARVQGATLEGIVLVDVAGTGAATLTASATPASLPAGGGRSALAATALDAQSKPVVGLPVAFSTSAGVLDTQGPIQTDAAGVASNGLTTTTSATVRAVAAGVSAETSVVVGRETTPSFLVVLTASPPAFQGAVPPPAVCGNAGSWDVTLTATVTNAGVAAGSQQVVFSANPARARAVAPGQFCENSVVLTDTNGKAVIHWTISAAEIQACRNIKVPCGGALCRNVLAPCPTATPVATPTPAMPQLNECCCGLEFRASVGSISSRLTYKIMTIAECPIKSCDCTF